LLKRKPTELAEWAEILEPKALRIPGVARVAADQTHVTVFVWTEDAGRTTWGLVRELGLPESAVRVERPSAFLIPYPNQDERSAEEIVRSFATERLSLLPVAAETARVLVLGSMPGNESLRRFEYYAHPGNRFWRLIEDEVGVARSSPYHDRIAALKDAGIALWDVLRYCRREGSLDHSIEIATEEPNDLLGFLRTHRSISTIALNGRKAAVTYYRLLAAHVDSAFAGRMKVFELPSTSPANTRFTYEALRREWKDVLDMGRR
jgi:double-stranded uracil-DNA glycosylase